MKDFTILIAHPDDELLFCWPVLHQAKRIVCASSDLNNPQRTWCRERRFCLEEVGRRIGAEVICFDYDSEFYQMPHRSGELKEFAKKIMSALQWPVFTHNAWGEYGHLDHILMHQIAMASGHSVWCSDISIELDWLPMRKYLMAGTEADLDQKQFDELKAIYDAKGCWTWSFDIPKHCGIYAEC